MKRAGRLPRGGPRFHQRGKMKTARN